MAKLSSSSTKRNHPKIAIIGAGPGGLYTAMRLHESGKFNNYDIFIFDAANSVGGRVKTLPIKKSPFTADIGAMRYIDKRQLIMNSLIKELGLDNDENKELLEVPTFSYFLRNRHILPHTFPGEKIQMPDFSNTKDFKRVKGKKNIKEQNAFMLKDWENYFAPGQLVVIAIFKALSVMEFGEVSLLPKADHGIISDTQGRRDELFRALDRDNYTTEEYVDRLKEFLGSIDSVGFEFFNLHQWKCIRSYATYHNKHLYETCLFNILIQELSPEAVSLGVDAFGYNNVFGAANAADHIPWFLNEFAGTHYHTIKNGMSVIINNLRDRISSFFPKDDCMQWLKLNHKLKSIDVDKEKGYVLSFVYNNEEVKYEKFEKVIFSISKGALERIYFPHQFKLNDKLRNCTGATNISEAVQCVTAYPLLKAFLFFKTAWFWQRIPEFDRQKIIDAEVNRKKIDLEIRPPSRINLINDKDFGTARVLTDLPIKQIYFHGSEGPWRRKYAEIDCDGMIMAYGDSRQSEFWASLSGRNKANHAKLYAIGNTFRKLFTQDEYDEITKEYGTTKTLVDTLQQNLKTIFEKAFPKRITQLESPIAAFIKDWNEAPYYGGWHAWCVNFKPWEVRSQIQRPFETESIYIVGEAFSSDQGWIEGALRSSEANLRKHFGLEKPDWIKMDFLANTSWITEDDKSKNRDSLNFENYLYW